MVIASGTQIAVKCIILSIPYLYLLGSVMKCQNVTILHWLQHAQCICQMYMLLCLVIVSECISGAALLHYTLCNFNDNQNQEGSYQLIDCITLLTVKIDILYSPYPAFSWELHAKIASKISSCRLAQKCHKPLYFYCVKLEQIPGVWHQGCHSDIWSILEWRSGDHFNKIIIENKPRSAYDGINHTATIAHFLYNL